MAKLNFAFRFSLFAISVHTFNYDSKGEDATWLTTSKIEMFTGQEMAQCPQPTQRFTPKRSL